MPAMVLIRIYSRDAASRFGEPAPGAVERFDAELVRAGVLLASERVRADADAVLVRPTEGSRAYSRPGQRSGRADRSRACGSGRSESRSRKRPNGPCVLPSWRRRDRRIETARSSSPATTRTRGR